MPKFEYTSSPQTLNGALETWFIQNILLDGIHASLKNDEWASRLEKIVYVELFNIDFEFIKSLQRNGKKVIILHMGDEFAQKNISEYSSCDLIIRSYYFPEVFQKNEIKNKILWIPNGFRTGVGPRNIQNLKPATQRQYLASFMGWIHNPNSFNGERESFARMIKSFRKSKGGRFKILCEWANRKLNYNLERRQFARTAINCNDLYILSSGGFSTGNNVGLYSAVTESSIFIPCPAGNSPETIRLYDALECGCIPITLDHEFLRSELALAAIGPVPFPIIKSWDALPDFISAMKSKLINDPESIMALQNQCITWWNNYKNFISGKITQRIAAL